MEIKPYGDNTFKKREEQSKFQDATEKRATKVINGNVALSKKNGARRFFDSLIYDDLPKVKDYIFTDVLVPSIKKALSDIIKTGSDLILYGDANKSRASNMPGSKVSYRSYYDNPNIAYNSQPIQPRDRSGLDYDNIIVGSRGDAELVLTQMEEIIQQYGMVRIADLYDLVGISTSNHCANNYGWTNLSEAKYILTRDGYLLKFPRALPID